MIAVAEHVEGCILPVRAQPAARRSGIQGEQGGALKIAVTAPPEKGRANRALIETLAEILGIKRSQIELIAGPNSRDKRLLIRAMTRAELQARLAALLEA